MESPENETRIRVKTNRLINEKSPYLLQHAHNPVDWYPWGPEAFARAVSEDKPIFLSIGYSTCHWCHVMERESFEDPEVAQLLNKYFISIKVDREERPDIDNIYMTVCQSITGHGGWPMSIFMTPDKKPFFAGTYFPKRQSMNMAGFMTILDRINIAWKQNKEAFIKSGDKIINAIQKIEDSPSDINAEEITHRAFSEFENEFDSVFGGFGNAPKFPTPHNLFFLLRYWYLYRKESALHMVEKTLDSMYKGGIYDHIGGGFSRYSTDKKWLIPHFEKMLYDNALLSIAYVEAYHATREEKYAIVAQDILNYVLRDMTSKEGGFYSAEDADSEGVEGKFYTWTIDEIKSVLGDADGEKYCKYYDILPKGNFESKNIPNLIKAELESIDRDFIEICNQRLYHHRDSRVHPYKDDKILTSWNGLMIAAMAISGRILGNTKYVVAAEKAYEFIESKLIRADKRLMARYRDGDTAYPGYVDDYAFLISGLIELYETTYKPKYLQKALDLNNDLIRLFWDEQNGGLFIYGSDSEQLITRPKEIYDGAMPSGNSVSALNFINLARLTGNHQLEDRAHQMFKTFGKDLTNFPRGYSFMLTALLFAYSPAKEVILVGSIGTDKMDAMVDILREKYNPFSLSMVYAEDYQDLKSLAPFVDGYKPLNNTVTAYVCENFSCKSPVTEVDDLRKILENKDQWRNLTNINKPSSPNILQ